MQKVNLEEILNKHLASRTTLEVDYDDYIFIKRAMKEACRQTLELAAENATIIENPQSYCGNTGSEYPPDQIVSEESILETIKQVE